MNFPLNQYLLIRSSPRITKFNILISHTIDITYSFYATDSKGVNGSLLNSPSVASVCIKQHNGVRMVHYTGCDLDDAE